MVKKYKSTFLKEVIVRVDFTYPLKKLSMSLPKDLIDKVKLSFPISEPREVFGKELEITKESTKEKSVEVSTEWLFHSPNRQKTLTISNNNINISYKEYDSFETLNQDFLPVVEELFKIFPDVQGRRLGLRYINEITLPEADYLNWDNYLDKRLLSSLSFPTEPNKICRAFNDLELNYGNLILRFQYGMFNSDYPAVIRKKSFILDYDAYFQGQQNIQDIKLNMVEFRKIIKANFEQSITDKLREKMNLKYE